MKRLTSLLPRSRRAAAGVLAAALALAASPALGGRVDAQGVGRPDRAQRGERGDTAGAPGRSATRAALDRRVQQAIARALRNRVGLNEAQMRQLVPVNRRFEIERREIMRQERVARQALRAAVLDSGAADQEQVKAHLDALLRLQRQRVDLVEREQKELAAFMTPVQRARYLALQEQVRRRLEQVRRPGGRAANPLR